MGALTELGKVHKNVKKKEREKWILWGHVMDRLIKAHDTNFNLYQQEEKEKIIIKEVVNAKQSHQ